MTNDVAPENLTMTQQMLAYVGTLLTGAYGTHGYRRYRERKINGKVGLGDVVKAIEKVTDSIDHAFEEQAKLCHLNARLIEDARREIAWMSTGAKGDKGDKGDKGEPGV